MFSISTTMEPHMKWNIQKLNSLKSGKLKNNSCIFTETSCLQKI